MTAEEIVEQTKAAYDAAQDLAQTLTPTAEELPVLERQVSALRDAWAAAEAASLRGFSAAAVPICRDLGQAVGEIQRKLAQVVAVGDAIALLSGLVRLAGSVAQTALV